MLEIRVWEFGTKESRILSLDELLNEFRGFKPHNIVSGITMLQKIKRVYRQYDLIILRSFNFSSKESIENLSKGIWWYRLTSNDRIEVERDILYDNTSLEWLILGDS